MPEILCVTLAVGISWRWTDRRHPVVPLEGREAVLNNLTHSHVDTVVDFDGLFASLLRPEELSDDSVRHLSRIDLGGEEMHADHVKG